MRRGRQRRHLPVVLAAVVLLAAACGSGKKAASSSRGAAPPGVTTSSVPGQVTSTTAGSGAGPSTTTTTSAGSATRAVNPPGDTTRTTTKAPARPTSPTVTAAPTIQVTTPPPTTPAEPVQPGGTLTALMPSESNGFDPTKGTGSATGGDMQRMFAVYDALIYQDPRSGNVIPETADSMTTSDAKVWILKIRPGIRFTDGTTYDASTVKFNWDRHADPKNASPWASTLKTTTYDVIDPLTLRITLGTPSGQFPRVVSRQLSYVASPAALTAAGSQAAYNDKPVGAGPFVLKSWTKDSQMVLERNPNYWNAPKPYLDRLIFKTIPDEAQREAALRTDDGDIGFTQYATTAADLAKDLTVTATPSIGSTLFYMNLTRPPFNDVAARKAMQLAVDTDQINRTVYGGALETPHGYFPATFPYSDPTLVFPSPNLAEAQRLVNDYVQRTGNDIIFTFSTGTTASQVATAQLVQSMVQKLTHVRMDIRVLSSNQFAAELVQHNFDADSFTYAGVDPEPEFNETVLSTGSRNFQGYSNAAVDKAVNDSRTKTDAMARTQSLKAAQQQLLTDMPFFVLNRSTSFWAAPSEIKDLTTFDDGGLLVDRVWIKSH